MHIHASLPGQNLKKKTKKKSNFLKIANQGKTSTNAQYFSGTSDRFIYLVGNEGR